MNQVRFVHRDRTITALPQMPGPALPRIDEAGVAPVGNSTVIP
jgi:hypothetical protein